MNELCSLEASLWYQRKRLKLLVEVYGENHPAQSYARRRITWLEERIAEEKKKRK